MKSQIIKQEYEFLPRPPTNSELVRAALIKMGGWAGLNQIAKETGLTCRQVTEAVDQIPAKRVEACIILTDFKTNCPVCETPLPKEKLVEEQE